MTVSDIIDVEGRGKFPTEELVEETQVDMGASYQIKMFCGNTWVTGKTGSLGNGTGASRMWDFWDRLGQTSVYTQVGHLLDTLMGIISKSLVYGFRKEIFGNSCDSWINKTMWNNSVWFILLDDVEINMIEVFFVSSIDSYSVSLGVAGGAALEGLVEGTKEATI